LKDEINELTNKIKLENYDDTFSMNDNLSDSISSISIIFISIIIVAAFVEVIYLKWYIDRRKRI
jgi:hypothetical protein